jgi:hypothetical protein
MEIHLTRETEKRLHALAAQSGGATVDELVARTAAFAVRVFSLAMMLQTVVA